jgi:hypothetical protein
VQVASDGDASSMQASNLAAFQAGFDRSQFLMAGRPLPGSRRLVTSLNSNGSGTSTNWQSITPTAVSLAGSSATFAAPPGFLFEMFWTGCLNLTVLSPPVDVGPGQLLLQSTKNGAGSPSAISYGATQKWYLASQGLTTIFQPFSLYGWDAGITTFGTWTPYATAGIPTANGHGLAGVSIDNWQLWVNVWQPC